MNRFFCIFATLSVFYLIQQPELVLSSSGGYGGGGGGASKLNLGVWIPPMTLRLPKFNMPKIKISATIKPRKNQPPMKIHLPEMSLNAKALGDDDNYGGGGHSYGGGNSGGYSGGGSYGGGNSYGGEGGGGGGYSSRGGDYGGSGGYSSGGSSYGGGDGGYSGGGSYSDGGNYGGSSGGYRASAASNQQVSNDQYQAPAQQSNYNNQPPASNYNSMDYGNRQQQDQRNAYYTVDNQPQQPPARYQQPESVSYSASSAYGASTSAQTGVYPATKYGDRTSYRSTSTGSGVQPLSNYATPKREKGGSAYGYAVNPSYAMSRYARN